MTAAESLGRKMMCLIRQQRWFRLLAAALLLGVLLCGVQTLTEPQRYTATANLLIINNDRMLRQMTAPPPAADERVRPPVHSPSGNLALRYTDLLQDRRPGGFVDRALLAAHMNDPLPRFDAVAQSEAEAQKRSPRLARLLRSVWIREKSSNILTIGLVWEDKEDCQKLVAAFRSGLIEDIGVTRQVQAVSRQHFVKQEIARVESELRRTEEPDVPDGAAGAEGLVRQVRQEALVQHLKRLHLQRLQWSLWDKAVEVTEAGIICPLNSVEAEAVVTPSHMLAEAPGRLLRCTVLSFVLLLAGVTLRRALLR